MEVAPTIPEYDLKKLLSFCDINLDVITNTIWIDEQRVDEFLNHLPERQKMELRNTLCLLMMAYFAGNVSNPLNTANDMEESNSDTKRRLLNRLKQVTEVVS